MGSKETSGAVQGPRDQFHPHIQQTKTNMTKLCTGKKHIKQCPGDQFRFVLTRNQKYFTTIKTLLLLLVSLGKKLTQHETREATSCCFHILINPESLQTGRAGNQVVEKKNIHQF